MQADKFTRTCMGICTIMVVVMGVLVWSATNTARVAADKANQLVEEDQMYSASWQHKPSGQQGCITVTVSDQDYTEYMNKYNTAIAGQPVAGPGDCP